jgi:DnaB-like helicase C terminal domain
VKFLLRSCFIAVPTDDPELSFRNYLALSESGLGFDVPEDTVLWEFVRDFARTHNHVPDVRTIRSHFENVKNPEASDRLELLAPLKPVFKGDFIKRLEERAEERRSRLVGDILREAAQILQTGVEVKEGKKSLHLRGPIDAVRYLVNKSHDIVMPTTGARLSGEITGDGEDFKREYEKVESDPLAGIGQFTGIQQMDEALGGAKKYELWTHAAFTGGLKSTLALNWLYNQAVYYKYDGLIFSLEMPYSQCRRILYAMHSLHGKFRDIRIQLGVQKSPGPNVGLDYGKIRDGQLAPHEKEFLVNHVIPDFNSGQYGKIHIEVSDPDKSDFNVADLRAKAELIYSKSPFNLLFVDHAGLLAPRQWVPSTTERLNEVLRDLKRLAMNFNRGAGMAVVNLFQISREGYKAAEKAAEKANANGGNYTNGPYNLTHLSYANECERSSDIVTASYVDNDLRGQNRVLFQCLKSRDQAPFLNHFARVEWHCRRILTSQEVPMMQGKKDDIRADEALKEIEGTL